MYSGCLSTVILNFSIFKFCFLYVAFCHMLYFSFQLFVDRVPKLVMESIYQWLI